MNPVGVLCLRYLTDTRRKVEVCVSFGTTIPRILSPEEAQKELPIPCLLILGGVAQPVFPFANRSTPSTMVLICKVREMDASYGGFRASLAYPVVFRQWRTAVIPVLTDERWAARNPLNVASLLTGGLPELLEQLGKALRTSFSVAGWGP